MSGVKVKIFVIPNLRDRDINSYTECAVTGLIMGNRGRIVDVVLRTYY